MRWCNYFTLIEEKTFEYKQKMEQLREKKKQELQESKLILQNYKSGGSKVFIADDLWKVVIMIMTGIEVSVRAFDYEAKQYINTDKDYTIKNTFEINNTSLESYRVAKFIDFAPTIFNYLRKLSGIIPDQYIESLGPEGLSKVITGNIDTFEGLTSAGKSGSLFFTSADKKYLVKTISNEEFNHFKEILPDYVAYISANSKSLLNRIYGLHQIETKTQSGVRERFTIVVMQNVMCTSNYLGDKYDLKGSTYKRKTKGNDFTTIPGKDLNILEKKLKFAISPKDYRDLVDQLKKDADFLAEKNIIDYSLLVGIHDRAAPRDLHSHSGSPTKKANPSFKQLETTASVQSIQPSDDILRKNLNSFETTDRKYKVYCGIIDMFTVFNLRKKSEFVLKRVFFGKGVSCVPPKQYGDRFLDFLSNSVFCIGDPSSPPGSPMLQKPSKPGQEAIPKK